MRPYRQVVLPVFCSLLSAPMRRSSCRAGRSARNRRPRSSLRVCVAGGDARRTTERSRNRAGYSPRRQPVRSGRSCRSNRSHTALHLERHLRLHQACHTHHPTSTASCMTSSASRKHKLRDRVDEEQQQPRRVGAARHDRPQCNAAHRERKRCSSREGAAEAPVLDNASRLRSPPSYPTCCSAVTT